MIPKEKAQELIDKYTKIEDDSFFYWEPYHDRRYFEEEILPHAKKCAILTVDEVIEELEDKKQYIDDNMLFHWNNEVLSFWYSVKTEIEKM